MTVAFDTSVLIAALASWHEDHDAAYTCIKARFRSDTAVVLPQRALIEAYSVLTRLPGGLRLAPTAAAATLHHLLDGRVQIVGIEPNATWALIDSLAAAEIAGGASYDADIAEAAVGAGAELLYTFNKAHFDRVAPAGLQVEVPRSLRV